MVGRQDMSGTQNTSTCPLPIVPFSNISLSPAEVERVQSLAQSLLREEPALAASEAFGPRVSSGLASGPSLFYEDHSEISLVRKWVTEAYKYRIALLARTGDLLAVSGPRKTAFEKYLRDVLALGQLEFITLPSDGDGPNVSTTSKLLGDETAIARLVTLARAAGSLNIVPYISCGGAWQLAEAIATQSGAEVRVAAPSPRLARRINDKLWFTRRVAELLGCQALPPSHLAFGPAALAARVARLARSNAQVVIKVPDSAGSIGNVVLAAETIRGLDIAGVRDLILGFLDSIGWRQTFPLMVGVWEAPVLMSPSVQAWIPTKEEGTPVIEGIFVQNIAGDTGRFIGAERVEPMPPYGDRLAHDAMLFTTLFQELGYYGRCSFDALFVGETEAEASLHWVECNARWGAVSIPMTLVNRLTRDWEHVPSIVIHRYLSTSTTHDLDQVLNLLDSHLFRPGASAGVVVIALGDAITGNGLEFMVIAPDKAAAMEIAENAARTLNTDGIDTLQ